MVGRAAGAGGQARRQEPVGLPGPPDPADETGETLSPDEAPRVCAACSKDLTVAERMFYFLEGSGVRPICRSCLVQGDPEGDELARRRLEENSQRPLRARHLRLLTDRSRRYENLVGAVRAFLADELDRLDGIVERLPTEDLDKAFLADLEGELRQEMWKDRLPEALVSLRDMRRIFSSKESGRARSALTAPWDESIEELYDRVAARSRAMERDAPEPATVSSDAGPEMTPDEAPPRRARS